MAVAVPEAETRLEVFDGAFFSAAAFAVTFLAGAATVFAALFVVVLLATGAGILVPLVVVLATLAVRFAGELISAAPEVAAARVRRRGWVRDSVNVEPVGAETLLCSDGTQIPFGKT